MQRVHLLITGRVQGVWFRDSTQTQARKLDLVGWVRNRRDGRVEVVAEGPKSALDALVLWCHRGPDVADVVDVDIDWQPAQNGSVDFAITSSY